MVHELSFQEMDAEVEVRPSISHFSCNQCDEVFSSELELQSHKDRTHAKQKQNKQNAAIAKKNNITQKKAVTVLKAQTPPEKNLPFTSQSSVKRLRFSSRLRQKQNKNKTAAGSLTEHFKNDEVIQVNSRIRQRVRQLQILK